MTAQEKKRSRELVEEDMTKVKKYGKDLGSGLGTEKVLHLILEAVLDIREMLEKLVDEGISTN